MRLGILGSESRRSTRLDVRFGAGLREPGSPKRFPIDILDLSLTGFRCETTFKLFPGNAVFVTIPSLGAIEATVAWADGYIYGCKFDRPLHNAVFDHIARTHGGGTSK